ncbi:MAG: hypothetical protein ACYTGZ_22345 [Planctomycetota bacterium]
MPLSDTHPAMTRHQVELMRKVGTEGRWAAARDLTRTVIELSRRGLRQRHPEATQAELDRMFVRLHYGDRVAGLLDA